MRRVLVLQTGTTLPQVAARHGDFAAWFMRAAGLSRHDVEVARVDRGDPLPAANRFSAVLVTGSASMVTEREGWSEHTAEWLAAAVQTAAAPLLGVCYGHQLLAHGLGGRVDWNPRGRQIGTKRLATAPAATGDPLFSGIAEFRAQTTHQQSVVVPPSGAQVLAHSSLDPHQALRFGPRAWGFQFHPEFSAGIMAGYIRGRADRLAGEGVDPALLLRECGPAPRARSLLRRFVRLSREGQI
ncbi:MAG TPA: glutamine amidotransferase [Tahibacter sp.]|uniref:glutamine amidotransferase n=1 Tax=Tahibacter sp. TaxID=2056211 RepID=UPI002BB0F172|nr:glutamine amidotransferase [Tahibacter sp.]HSX61578.1 glutamine amidotransferase [Tahibacter sp.]